MVLLRIAALRRVPGSDRHHRLAAPRPQLDAQNPRAPRPGVHWPDLLWPLHLAFSNFYLDSRMGGSVPLRNGSSHRLAADFCGGYSLVLLDRTAIHAGTPRSVNAY